MLREPTATSAAVRTSRASVREAERLDGDVDAYVELDGRRLRGMRRREQILEAATRLIRERGFSGVTMEDIGEAAGVTGPAVYRHFQSKDEVLVSVLAPAVEVLWAAPPTDVEGDALAALDAFLSRLARIAVEQPDVIVLWYHEGRNLPDDERHTMTEQVRRTVDSLARLLRKARPELAAAEARVTVENALVVATYVGYPGTSRRVSGERLYRHLVRLARAVLRA